VRAWTCAGLLSEVLFTVIQKPVERWKPVILGGCWQLSASLPRTGSVGRGVGYRAVTAPRRRKELVSTARTSAGAVRCLCSPQDAPQAASFIAPMGNVDSLFRNPSWGGLLKTRSLNWSEGCNAEEQSRRNPWLRPAHALRTLRHNAERVLSFPMYVHRSVVFATVTGISAGLRQRSSEQPGLALGRSRTGWLGPRVALASRASRSLCWCWSCKGKIGFCAGARNRARIQTISYCK